MESRQGTDDIKAWMGKIEASKKDESDESFHRKYGEALPGQEKLHGKEVEQNAVQSTQKPQNQRKRLNTLKESEECSTAFFVKILVS